MFKDAKALLKSYIRAAIRDIPGYRLSDTVEGTALNLLEQFCQTCRQLDGAVLGMKSKQFPAFLVPGPDINLAVIIHRCFFPGISQRAKVGGRAKCRYHLQDLGSYLSSNLSSVARDAYQTILLACQPSRWHAVGRPVSFWD